MPRYVWISVGGAVDDGCPGGLSFSEIQEI